MRAEPYEDSANLTFYYHSYGVYITLNPEP